jgi:hypothetical protein
MAGTISFDVSAFRAQCPEYANADQYPDATVEGYWSVAATSISATDYGALSGAARVLALNLLTGHLMALADKATNGEAFGVVSQAGVDKVTVAIAPPPFKSGWDYWLSTSSRGAQLLALLQAKSTGGFYVGGSSEAFGFRQGRR